jgi:hypothetical protein
MSGTVVAGDVSAMMDALNGAVTHRHAQELVESAISPAVAAQRGYQSIVANFDKLAQLGFAEWQWRGGLLIPIHDAAGEIVLAQLKPDEPRLNDDGERIKYEPPHGSRLRIDVPVASQKEISDPAASLVATEGCKKADAGASHGATIISLQGVSCWRGRNVTEGRTALADWKDIALNHRTVYLAYDSDAVTKPEVQAEEQELTRYLESKGATVWLIRIPPVDGLKKTGLDDYLFHGGNLNDLIAKAVKADSADAILARTIGDLARMSIDQYARERSAAAKQLGISVGVLDRMVKAAASRFRHKSDGAQLPAIETKDVAERTIIAQGWNALVKANDPPRFFNFAAGIPVRIAPSVKPSDDGCLVTQDLTEKTIRYELAHSAEWLKDSAPTLVPRDIAAGCLAAPTYPLPPLRRIVRIPIFTKNKLLIKPGYDPDSQLYLAAQFDLPYTVDNKPSRETIKKATDILSDLLVDFPFSDVGSKANAIAAMIEPFAREQIDGCTPIYQVGADKGGTGKGLLDRVILTPAFGTRWISITAPKDERDWRNELTSKLRETPEAIVIDNVSKFLDSPSLASAVTKEFWDNRELGVTRQLTLEIRCSWHILANNLDMTDELTRRCVRIQLHRDMDHPELLDISELAHPNVLSYAVKQRPAIIWAILTLISAWIAANRPKPSCSYLGSFESWRDVIGGILQVAGIDGFLTEIKKHAADADPETERWRALVEKWWIKFGENEVRAADLLPLAEEIDGFHFGRSQEERARQTAFGIRLRKRRNQVFTFADAAAVAYGTFKIVCAGTRQGLAYYNIEQILRKPTGEGTV